MWEMKPDGDGTQQDTFWERNRLNFDTKEHDHFFFLLKWYSVILLESCY